MARISSEEARLRIGNQYDMILIAARRTRELRSGHRPMVQSRDGDTITALREIEAGLVGRDYLLKPQDMDTHRQRRREPSHDDQK